MNFKGGNKDTKPLHESRGAIDRAKRLTKGKTTVMSKFKAIYRYIRKHVRYDYEELALVLEHEIALNPYADEVLRTGKGTCWDMAVLLAVMCKVSGIETKIVKGYADFAPDTYHAWNEVLIKGGWYVVDMVRRGKVFQDENEYHKKTEI